MKTKKIIAIASAVILAVSSLAGCGSNNKKVEEGNITLTAYDKNVTTSFGFPKIIEIPSFVSINNSRFLLIEVPV